MTLVGRKNAYVCDLCGGYVVTIDRDEGVTPMFLACRVNGEPGSLEQAYADGGCMGRMRSMMYPREPWPLEDDHGHVIPTEPTWEWYLPSLGWARRKGPEMLDHVRRGGLVLRRIENPEREAA